jgi:hypothetical protein
MENSQCVQEGLIDTYYIVALVGMLIFNVILVILIYYTSPKKPEIYQEPG